MVKVYLDVDRAAAIKAGLDQWGRQAVEVDVGDLPGVKSHERSR